MINDGPYEDQKRKEMGMDGGPYKYFATKKNISGRNIYSVVASYLYVWMKFHQGPI